MAINHYPTVFIFYYLIIKAKYFKYQEYHNMISIKDQFAYFNNQSFLEIKKTLEEKCSSYLSNLKNYSDFKTSQTEKVIFNYFYCFF